MVYLDLARHRESKWTKIILERQTDSVVGESALHKELAFLCFYL